jgi:RNA polymerase sigma-70 factor, ECF subfamily
VSFFHEATGELKDMHCGRSLAESRVISTYLVIGTIISKDGSVPVVISIKSKGMGDSEDELEWIRRSREGDTQAFEALVLRHQRMIHTLTYRMTGSLADAADLAQESFIRAFHRLDDFRGDAKFSSWLYQIAVHACLNWKQSHARRERLHRDWAEQERALGAKSSADKRPPDEHSRPVQEALLKLPAKQRAAIVLTVYEEMNHAEAARVLGCSETTVSWRVFAARRKLKHLLKNHRP